MSAGPEASLGGARLPDERWRPGRPAPLAGGRCSSFWDPRARLAHLVEAASKTERGPDKHRVAL